MDKPLSRLEARLQRLIEEGTARLFTSKDIKVELMARLTERMQAEVQFNSEGELVAPYVYTIEVNSQHAAALKGNQSLLSQLQSALVSAAKETKILLVADPVINVAPSDELSEGDFRVHSARAGEKLGDTQGLVLPKEVLENRLPSGAFFIVNGAKVFPLKQVIINIGRKSDNHLVIEDSHISRRHAQLRAIDGHYHFFDLGSTGGSSINGQPVKNASLLAGDVISLAGVPLIYGQDASSEQSETKEVGTGKRAGGDGTTADRKTTP